MGHLLQGLSAKASKVPFLQGAGSWGGISPNNKGNLLGIKAAAGWCRRMGLDADRDTKGYLMQ